MDYARFSRGLKAQIAKEEERAMDAGVPPVPRGRIGPHAIRAWAELDDEVAVKREIIRTVADIKLKRDPKGTRKPFGAHRLDWRWKLAPDGEASTA
jgi:site-specific DNA recombinase